MEFGGLGSMDGVTSGNEIMMKSKKPCTVAYSGAISVSQGGETRQFHDI
jgi:hypothetical protein